VNGLEAPVHASHSRRMAAILVSIVPLGVFPMTASRSSAQTSAPTLERAGIRTTPFRNTQISMGDGEGSAYVARDRSLWLADDNRGAIFEVGPTTGKLKGMIGANAVRSTTRLGGGARAGRARSGDFEAMAYDAAKDELYLFSGACCLVRRPTVFRLTRDGRDDLLWPDSWQPLKRDTDFSAAGWNPADGRVYVGEGPDLRTYDYRRNAIGQVPGLTGILGTGFSRDGSEMCVVTNQEELHAVDWATKTLVPGWSFDLTPHQILDSRAVERIGDSSTSSMVRRERATTDSSSRYSSSTFSNRRTVLLTTGVLHLTSSNILVGRTVWSWFHRRKEQSRIEGDDEFLIPRTINWPALALFWTRASSYRSPTSSWSEVLASIMEAPTGSKSEGKSPRRWIAVPRHR